mmetsp:Transcript_119194/g.229922  ORF Transcript_119194/g.229922 Transcript_119194/m.229922 type:complete len:232 (+) Transcript_119194:965-1660(+)
MITPLGIFAPSAEYLAGSLRKSTTSVSSSFAPSAPATSLKVTPVCGSIWIFERDLPTSKGLPPGPPMVFIPPIPPLCWLPRDERKARKRKGTMLRTAPKMFPPGRPGAPLFSGGSTVKGTSFCWSLEVISAACSVKITDSWRLPSLSMQRTCLPSAEKLTFSTRLLSTASRNCLVDHGVPFGSAAEAACAEATRPATPVAAAASLARRIDSSSRAPCLITIGRRDLAGVER